jgi:hypothetical protein
MTKLTFLQLAEKVLEEEGRPLSQMEIWECAVKRNLDSLVGSSGKTPWATIGARIYIELRDNSNTKFGKTDTSPVRFYLKQAGTIDEVPATRTQSTTAARPSSKFNFKERDLHHLLAYFAHYYMQLHTKTIDHSRSHKRGKSHNEWLHPDMIGVYYPFGEWHAGVFDFSKLIGASTVRLVSFELKRELGFENLRASFFQAVSNSSWANEGYLVAAEIDEDSGFRLELKRLSNSFGIGVIRLDVKDAENCEILYPARTSRELDWDTMNKLAVENRDFEELMGRIQRDISGKEIRLEWFDRIMSAEELLGLFGGE